MKTHIFTWIHQLLTFCDNDLLFPLSPLCVSHYLKITDTVNTLHPKTSPWIS